MRSDRFCVMYTLAGICASAITGHLTACWVGLLVYAVSTLELIVILLVFGGLGWWSR